MMILLSCAKTMDNKFRLPVPQTTDPVFLQDACKIAEQMAEVPIESLQKELRVNHAIAIENRLRYQSFFSEIPVPVPAIFSYTGIVFKTLSPDNFTSDDFIYAQDHLRITSFCYGLLRPLDVIKNYRLEGNIKLPTNDDITLFNYWKSRLTDHFIAEIQSQGGTLINLASNEMKQLFEWSRIEKSCRVISPEFKIIKNGKPKTIVVYTKMARGAMTRYILKNRIEDPEELLRFEWEGFAYDPSRSNDNCFFYLQY